MTVGGFCTGAAATGIFGTVGATAAIGLPEK
jgi:hypothetical protein